jgi:hypothetical protein
MFNSDINQNQKLNKIRDVIIFNSGLLVALIALSFQKTALGNDERHYLHVGLEFLQTLDYESTKYLPLPSVLLASLSSILSSDLIAARFIYVLSIVSIANAALLFAKTHFPASNYRYVALFVSVIPGVLYLNLYSVINLLAVALQVHAIYFLSVYLKTRKTKFLLFFTTICAAAYLTRLDSLILYTSGIFLLLLLQFRNTKTLKLIKIAILSISFFVLLISFWQLHLFSNNLIFSQGATGGPKTWPTGVWPLMVEIPQGFESDFYDGSTTVGKFSLERTLENSSLIFRYLGLNFLQYSEALASPQLIPLINYMLLGALVASKVRIPTPAFPIFLPFLLPLAYLGYGGPFSVERYLTLVAFPVGVLASLCPCTLKIYDLRVSLACIAFVLNFTLSLGALFFGNQTYLVIIP